MRCRAVPPDHRQDTASDRRDGPGTTIEQTEAVADQVTAILQAARGRAHARADQRRQRGCSSCSSPIATRQLRVRAAHDARAAADPRRAGQLPAAAGGGGGTGRDISVMLTGSDPALLEQHRAARWSSRCRASKASSRRASRADLQRPELIITPRLDLAAQLGVTTTALSQAIRIATIGEIDQNAAKFSLSATARSRSACVLPEDSRAGPVDDREPAGADRQPAARCRSRASPRSASAPGRRRSSATTSSAASSSAPTSRPDAVKGDGDGGDQRAADHAEPARRRLQRARSATTNGSRS